MGAMNKNIRSQIRRQGRSVLETGSRYKSFDQVRQRHFWSTYLFTPDANGYIASGQNFNLFSTPQGQSGQGFTTQLTDLETNWKGANRVPDNQNIMITEIGVTVGTVPFGVRGGAVAANVPDGLVTENFLENTTVSIVYLTNQVELGRCSDFAQASGPTHGAYAPSTAALSTPRFVTNGLAAPGLRRRFKVPILLQHGETFSFAYIIPRSFNIGVAGTTQQVYARLDFWATESFVEKS